MSGLQLVLAIGFICLGLVASPAYAANPTGDLGAGRSLDQGFMTDRLIQEDIEKKIGTDIDQDIDLNEANDMDETSKVEDSQVDIKADLKV